MTLIQAEPLAEKRSGQSDGAKSRRPRFGQKDDFLAELRRRVHKRLQDEGRRERDCPQMYLKTGIILVVFAVCYGLLVFAAQTWWQALPLVLMLGLLIAAVGFNIQHDAGHGAYSERPWLNRAMAFTLDLVGGSSYIWHWKHAVLHHTYVNITGHDTDIDLGLLGRLTPHQRRRAFHRWQHFYLWPLYGFIVLKWHLWDDFVNLATSRIGGQRFPRPKGWDLVTLVAGKALFLSLAFVVPMMFHPFWAVLLAYGTAAITAGIILSVVFQLAHCVEEAEFPMPQADTGDVATSWAIHQVQTTVDFARRSRVASWLLGGLNFQVEHHLLPRVCHVNYPSISKVVEETCRDFGVRYQAHRTVWAGIASHFRWLRQMGLPCPSSASR